MSFDFSFPAYKNTPFPKQYTILSNKWGAVHSPKADGTIPEKAQHILLGMGCWLSINGKAICGTTPWIVAGEDPTKLKHEGAFSDGERLQYTAKDLRHVLNGDTLYAIMLGLTGTRDAADRSHAVDLSR